METESHLGKVKLSELKLHCIAPGAYARFVHSEHCTLAFWHLDKGAVIPRHQHRHEACPVIIRGALQFKVGDEEIVLREGECRVVASNVPHEAVALDACEIFEMYSPVREDYRALDQA
ncbi:cupin [Burkholderia ubonensis]|uniref:cupin domain-containing protein n=1 Tax=Burkholderia ubonensis TaxID=101571 RepID=UPI000757C22B|nr:cupin domain-containing protein [Burkholderia ubonensis]KVZ90851.1 cupin [Burkholderia ubonensis]